MEFNTTNVYSRIIEAIVNKCRLIILQGGTSSSKTYSSLQALITIALYSKEPYLISIVSESMPHLKKGVIRDFKKILGDYWEESRWRKTDFIYTFPSGVQVEFFGADNGDKLRGSRRDILYINECNNVSKAAYDQLEPRTRKFVIVDFNPVEKFYIHKFVRMPKVCYFKSTYLDAKHVLDQTTIDSIESRRETDPNWWNVFGLGEIGTVEGRVFLSFTQIDCMPSAGSLFYGQDFGFTNDPSALVQTCIIDKSIYFHELIYETGLLNAQLAQRYEIHGIRKYYDEIFADGARPDIIADIHQHGYNVKGAPKGKDSVTLGIGKLNEYKIHWTKDSVNGIKEMRGYRYIQDKDGKYTNKPQEFDNHLMDACRYSVTGHLNRSVTQSAQEDWI